MEMNEAIYTVLHAQYKKDEKEAFKMVENAGYEVAKYDGHFRVENLLNRKYIYMGKSYRGLRYYYNHGDVSVFDDNGDYRPVDFVNLLAKNPNNVAHNCRTYNEWEGKRQRLSNAKYFVQRYQKDIDKKKAEINKLMDEMLYYHARVQEYANEVDNLRKEYGLTTKENGGV